MDYFLCSFANSSMIGIGLLSHQCTRLNQSLISAAFYVDDVHIHGHDEVTFYRKFYKIISIFRTNTYFKHNVFVFRSTEYTEEINIFVGLNNSLIVRIMFIYWSIVTFPFPPPSWIQPTRKIIILYCIRYKSMLTPA